MPAPEMAAEGAGLGGAAVVPPEGDEAAEEGTAGDGAAEDGLGAKADAAGEVNGPVEMEAPQPATTSATEIARARPARDPNGRFGIGAPLSARWSHGLFVADRIQASPV
jgi:hypothetical protein